MHHENFEAPCYKDAWGVFEYVGDYGNQHRACCM
jgi:hypothetical protein